MPVHKKILGGEQYLPFALTKLRQLAARSESSGGYASAKWTVDDGSTILIEVRKDEHFVTIYGSPQGYEFFTTEQVSQETYGTPGAPILDDGVPIALGSGTRYNPKTGKAKPLFSNALTGGWKVPDNASLNFGSGAESIKEATWFFRTWASWQQQKTAEYVWWLNNESEAIVTSTKSLGYGRLNQAGVFGNTTCYTFDWTAQDAGFDVPPAYYDKNGSQVGAPQLEEGVWWRRAAVQEVMYNGVPRRFFIMTDTVGRFHVYPVKPYHRTEPDYDYLFLPPEKFKTATPTYPSWVTVPAVGETSLGAEFVWTFNKDATKAVTIPFHRQDAEVVIPDACQDMNPTAYPGGAGTFASYTAAAGGTYTLSNPNKVYFYTSGTTPYKIPSSGTARAKTDFPGLLEVGIEISVTGPNSMDFEVEVNVLQTDYYLDSGRYYIDAGYLLKNERLGETAETVLGAPEDTLLTAEIELWGADERTDDYYLYRNGSYDIARAAWYVVRNHATQEKIRQIFLGRYWEYPPGFDPLNAGHVGPWRSYNFPQTYLVWADLRSLSFVAFTGVRANEGWILSHPFVHVWNRPIAHPWPYDSTLPAFIPPHEESESGYEHIGYDLTRDYLADLFIEPSGSDEPLPFAGQSLTVAVDSFAHAHQAFVTPDLNAYVSVHPQGHWASSGAFSPDINAAADVIQAYKRDAESGTWSARTPTKHCTQFNSAFGQSRIYTFYPGRRNYYLPQAGIIAAYWPEQGTYGWRGSFCSTSIWAIFDKTQEETP